MEPIVLRFTPTPGDYSRTIFAMSWRRYRLWLALFVVLAIGLVAALWVPLLLTLLARDVPVTRNEILMAASSSVSALTCAFVVPAIWLGLGQLMALWQVNTKERLRLETTLTFDDSTFVSKNAFAELKQDWSNYHDVIETRQLYILRLALNKNAGQFIPRRAFVSPEQEAAFRDLLKRKLNFKG